MKRWEFCKVQKNELKVIYVVGCVASCQLVLLLRVAFREIFFTPQFCGHQIALGVITLVFAVAEIFH